MLARSAAFPHHLPAVGSKPTRPRVPRRALATRAEMSLSEACCRAGKDWSGTPSGKDVKIGGLDAYVAGQGSSDKAILLLHDIFGFATKNARLYADKMAACGFVAVLPDFFHGEALKPGFDFSIIPQYLAKFPHDKVEKEIDAVLAELRSASGIKHVGAVGFCWGGYYAVVLAGDSKVDAAVICHGSRLKLENIETIAKPTLFLCSDNDKQIPREMVDEIKQVLSHKSFDTDVVFYPGMEHGWTLRGDVDDEKVAKDAQDAFQRAATFFEKHVK